MPIATLSFYAMDKKHVHCITLHISVFSPDEMIETLKKTRHPSRLFFLALTSLSAHPPINSKDSLLGTSSELSQDKTEQAK